MTLYGLNQMGFSNPSTLFGIYVGSVQLYNQLWPLALRMAASGGRVAWPSYGPSYYASYGTFR
jgi:hypothetical protein